MGYVQQNEAAGHHQPDHRAQEGEGDEGGRQKEEKERQNKEKAEQQTEKEDEGEQKNLPFDVLAELACQKIQEGRPRLQVDCAEGEAGSRPTRAWKGLGQRFGFRYPQALSVVGSETFFWF